MVDLNIFLKELNNGQSIPMLGLGSWQLIGQKCEVAVRHAIELGYRHIDTAEVYGNEREIGEGISGFDRKKLWLTSKLYRDNFDYYSALSACNDSLKRLGIDYLDLYLVHWPRRGSDYNGVFKAFSELQETGKVKSLGVSNFTINHLEKLVPVAQENNCVVSVNQVEFHPLFFQKDLLEYCDLHGIALTAYSPLARGKVFDEPILQEIAEVHGKSAGQVSLNWLVSKGLIVIPKASSAKHQKENLDVLTFKLKKDEIERIDSIEKNQRLVVPKFAEFDK